MMQPKRLEQASTATEPFALDRSDASQSAGAHSLVSAGIEPPTAPVSPLLRCPKCRGRPMRVVPKEVRCVACDYVARFNAGVLDLRLDATQDTALDIETYDAQHSLNEESARSLIDLYNKVIASYARVQPGRVLEIGAGTGNLTWGLCNRSSFTDVHCSDISQRFMAKLHAKLAESSGTVPLHSYLFDANDLPFVDNIFSAVLGHSVLHHLASFDRTVEDAHRVLQPGGIAIFGEPVMDAHALTCLAARQIVRADEFFGEQRKLSPQSRLVLSAIADSGPREAHFLADRPPEVHKYEDKFIFPIEYFRQLSRRIGFTNFEVVQWAPVRNIGALIEASLATTLNANRASGDDLISFRPLLESFTDTYEASMAPFISQDFALFIFVK